MKLLLIIILFFAISVSAQKVEVEQSTLDRIQKQLELSAQKDDLIKILKAEIEAKEAVITAQETQVKTLKEIIELNNKRIELLEKRNRRELSVFFGILKVRF